jgi:putative tricarboxylic transport membrane protein
MGLFLSSVGGDPITGEARFTFGYFPMISGFNLLAVVIGVCALNEVLTRVAEKLDSTTSLASFSRIVLPSFASGKFVLEV